MGEKTLVDVFKDAAQWEPADKDGLRKGVQAVADEAIRRYLASLPPGDEGLARAYLAADNAAMVQAGYPAEELGFDDYLADEQQAMCQGIAAVIDLHERRELQAGHLRINVEVMEKAGWLPPDKAAGLEAERDRWKKRAESWADEIEKIHAQTTQAMGTWRRERTSKMGNDSDG